MNNRLESPSILFHYYKLKSKEEFPLLPFLAAPYKQFQQSLIIAPANITPRHDQFISELYKHTSNRTFSTYAIRLFKFESMLSVAFLFPSEVKDESGRGGSLVSLGFLVADHRFVGLHKVLSAYFDKLIEIINQCTNLRLPSPVSVYHLANKINSGLEESESLNLDSFLRSSLLVSSTLGKITSLLSYPKRTIVLRWPTRKIFPKVLAISPNLSISEVLEILLHEYNFNNLPNDVLAIYKTEIDENPSVIPLIRFSALPQILKFAKKTILGKKNYLRIYI